MVEAGYRLIHRSSASPNPDRVVKFCYFYSFLYDNTYIT